MKHSRFLLMAMVLVFALVLGACSNPGTNPKGADDKKADAQKMEEKKDESKDATDSSKEMKKLHVVATTTMLYDLTKVIGGENVEVMALMNAGVDPHLYQASAGDVEKLQNADVVVYNGLHLEGKMGEIFSALTKQNKNVICVEDGIDKSVLLEDEEDASIPDPHIWFDAMIWKQAAQHVAKELSKIDSANEAMYMANYENYAKELDDLHKYIQDRVNELPENQRVLITAHDAFRYFGRGYQFTVKGLQGISTVAEAGTSDVSELAKFISDNKIKAIFVESSVPAKNIEALQAAVKANGFDVQIGGELYSDSLGDVSDNHETYIKTVKANIDTIVDALK